MMLNSEDDRYHDLDDFEDSSSMPHGGQPPVVLPSQVCMPPPPAKQARSKAKAPGSKMNGASKRRLARTEETKNVVLNLS